MGFRFQRRFRVLPGVTLNLGKRNASVSLGVKGAHFTVGTRGTTETIGLPGSGLYYTQHQALPHGEAPTTAPAQPASEPTPVSDGWGVARFLIWLAIFGGLAVGAIALLAR
jgi:hypothetical protein